MPEASIPSGSTTGVSSPPSTRKRKKSVAQRRALTAVLDMDDQDLIKFDSESDSEEDPPLGWFVVTGWRVIPTHLGELNALYRIDGVIKYFTYLRAILHLVDRQDLIVLYGFVVKHYALNTTTWVGLML